MSRTWKTIHITLIALWGIAALVLAIDIAVLGGEEAQLTRSRGADRQAQLELTHRRDRLASEVERAANPARLAEAKRHLKLPIQPPVEVAANFGPERGE